MIDVVRKMFKKVQFSESGSNARVKEESAYMMFLEYLDECEKGTSSLPRYDNVMLDTVVYRADMVDCIITAYSVIYYTINSFTGVQYYN